MADFIARLTGSSEKHKHAFELQLLEATGVPPGVVVGQADS